MRQRREFDWRSVWLLLSAFFLLAGCFVAPYLTRRRDASLAIYWATTFASLIASTAVFLRHSYLRGERELRRRQGLCPRCGYDLTGNVSGVCPECGTVAGATR